MMLVSASSFAMRPIIRTPQTILFNANDIAREHEILQLSAEDRRIFANALLHPPVPNEKLRCAAERHEYFEV